MTLQPSSKPGDLYLGGRYDLEAGKLLDEPVHYDSRDLVTHGVCIGMTGSGKTGLCIGLLEECALSGIPALIIDPKGDMGNLLLTFPELRAEDFRPWINPDEARRKGLEPDALAEKQATAWREGLGSWGMDGQRIRKLRESAEFTIFTPGSSAGAPLNILQSFDAPSDAATLDDETLRDEIAGAVSALLGLLGGVDASTQSPPHILLSRILEDRWRAGAKTDLAALISLIQTPSIERLGALPLETFLPTAQRVRLAMQLNTLLASPSFQSWIEGEPLDMATLLRTPEGRPRVSICCLSHLGDAERMFFVSLLLNKALAWMRAQPGSTTLKALLYFDEIFGYLPPHPKDPPSKRLLMTILKQGRAFGLGTLLVTQNPVDLDYKALSNCGTWMIGKLQTDQDKARILDGLQGAVSEAGGGADRAELDRILGRLGNRVFLLHNVHGDGPVVMQSRWVMSYLAGPLTRAQIRELKPSGPGKAPAAETPAQTGSLADFIGGAGAVAAQGSDVAPAIPAGLSVRYETAPAGSVLVPSLFARADLFFKDGAETATRAVALAIADPANLAARGWTAAGPAEIPEAWGTTPPTGVKFAPLPSPFQEVATLKKLGSGLTTHLAQSEKLMVFENVGLKLRSSPGEAREAFDARCTVAAAALGTAGGKKLREVADKASATLQARVTREEAELERDRARVATRKREEATSLLSNLGGAVLSMLGGRKATGARKIGSAFSSAMSKRGMSERTELEVKESEQTLAQLRAQLAELGTKLEADVAALKSDVESKAAQTTETAILPTKTNITVREFGVLWRKG